MSNEPQCDCNFFLIWKNVYGKCIFGVEKMQGLQNLNTTTILQERVLLLKRVKLTLSHLFRFSEDIKISFVSTEIDLHNNSSKGKEEP